MRLFGLKSSNKLVQIQDFSGGKAVWQVGRHFANGFFGVPGAEVCKGVGLGVLLVLVGALVEALLTI